ncbi:hypothetical protein CW304_03110 [Bacillus sp. UFRGS-B20]|nr:hypothetical protein CW304_03110 [Bacillus sp. UFRGS-B20]
MIALHLPLHASVNIALSRTTSVKCLYFNFPNVMLISRHHLSTLALLVAKSGVDFNEHFRIL